LALKLNLKALIYENDKEIIDEYKLSGSSVAANAFVRRYQKFVYSTALRYLGNSSDAEDIAQDVFVKALSSLGDFRAEADVKTWLYTITANFSKSALRKRKFRSMFMLWGEEENFEQAPSSINIEKNVAGNIFREKFEKALFELPEKQRETFALRFYEELSYEEISKLLGTSVGGLKANYFQAVKKLANLLKDYKDGF